MRGEEMWYTRAYHNAPKQEKELRSRWSIFMSSNMTYPRYLMVDGCVSEVSLW